MGLLKPESKAVKHDRYTLTQAIENIPKVNAEVTDIVFQVGLNDLRRGMSPEEIQEKTLDMQLAYNKCFPNARQHLTALPPLENEHVHTNDLLQKLATYTS